MRTALEVHKRRIRMGAALVMFTTLASALTGCLEPSTGFTSGKSSSSSSSATILPAGAKAAQVIFTDTAPALTGSFDPPPSGGTAPAQGSGLQAVVLFNPDGTKLANGKSDPNWPQWLDSVELGVTGTNNTYTIGGTNYSSDPNCARFTTSTESTNKNCNFGAGASTADCDGPSGGFRVSEADCDYGTDPNNQGVGTGSGTPSDNVYIRANFNRADLGSTENVMVVVKYAASSYHGSDPNPNDCFNGGVFSPEYCSDFTWKVFLRHNSTETVQPFMVFLPPTYSYVVNNPNASGATPETKQFIIPLAGDPTLDTVQFSRITKPSGTMLLRDSDTNFISACDSGDAAGGTTTLQTVGANSPLCAGVVFYSMTFFRI